MEETDSLELVCSECGSKLTVLGVIQSGTQSNPLDLHVLLRIQPCHECKSKLDELEEDDTSFRAVIMEDSP